jgi:Flp pilus assembly protein TadD
MNSVFKVIEKIARRITASPWICAGLVLLLVASVYGEVCSFHFLPFWDDDTNIHRNPLYSPLSWASISRFWEGPFQQLYIPVTYSVWGGLVALSRLVAGTSIAVGPLNSAIFHGANLIVHLFSTGMVFLIIRRLLSALNEKSVSRERVLGVATAGALFYALHPIQVESVAWVSGLRDLLGGAFSLAALACFFSFLEEPRIIKGSIVYLSATILLVLAFGSKPGSVVTPALALLLGAWLLNNRKVSFKKLLWLAPWFLIAVAAVIMTSKAQPAAELASSLVPLWARPLVACDAVAFYLGKIFFPFSLCADYGRSPNSALASGLLAWTWIFPIGLTVLFIVVKNLRCYLIPMALLVIGVLPTLGFIPFNFQVVSTVADHYLYLAMLGPALAFALLLSQLSAQTAILTSLIIIPCWTILSLIQLPEWRVGNSFFPATLACNPTSWKSRHNYACTLDSQGKELEALSEFTEAIRLRPSNAEAHNDMALTLMKLGRNQEAAVEFQHSLQIRPTTGAARNLAALLLMLGNPSQAVEAYRFAMQVDPGDLQNQRALAWVLATHPDDSVRNGQEAVALAKQIVSATNGQVPIFLLTLSAALAEVGDFDQALVVATQSAQVFQNTGNPKMSQLVMQLIIPALQNHQKIRENPAK